MLNRKSLIVVVSLLSSSSIVALNNSYAAGAFADHEVGISRRAASVFPGLSLRGLLVAATAVFSGATYTREEGSKSMSIVSGRELPYVAAGADYAATGGVGPLAVTSYNPLDTSFLETAVDGAGVADHGSSLTAHHSERDAVTAGAHSRLRGGSVLDAREHNTDSIMHSTFAWPEKTQTANNPITVGETEYVGIKSTGTGTLSYWKDGVVNTAPTGAGIDKAIYHYTMGDYSTLADPHRVDFHITEYFKTGGLTPSAQTTKRIQYFYRYSIPKDGNYDGTKVTFIEATSGSPNPKYSPLFGDGDTSHSTIIIPTPWGGTDARTTRLERAKAFVQALYVYTPKPDELVAYQ